MTQIISIAQRHKYILDKLKKDGYIRVADIAKSLKVTAVTVRKDFKALEEQGLLFRTHGSACPVNPHVADRSVQLKELENRVQKEKIAQAATQLLEENDSVIIATGSTIMAFAEKIVPKGTLNVVTPSLKVSMLLSAVGNVNIIQLGGVVHKKSLSVRGTRDRPALYHHRRRHQRRVRRNQFQFGRSAAEPRNDESGVKNDRTGRFV